MDRLIAANSVPLAQADTAPATGTPQYATDGNPASNIPATRWPAYAFNAIQDEIYNVIAAAGITPDRTKWNQLITAIQTMLQGSTTSIATDTGTANAYVIAFTPAITEPLPWVPFWFNVKTTNTGASTLNATGTAEPLVGAAHSALQGGELVQHGNALAYWNPTLASGAGSYVLLFCSGAPEQIAPGTEPEHAAQLQQIGHGQCRLTMTSATQLTLVPRNGNNLIINGVPQQIPAGGVTLANTGLASTTFYYVYAYMNSGTMELEASTTGHSTGTNGVEIKTGDPSRSLVGAFYTNGSSPGQFTDSTTARYTLSWFNRRKLNMALSGSVGAFTNTASVTELDTTKRLFWINWSDEAIKLNLSGQCINANGGYDVILTGGLDNGTVVTNQSGGTIVTGGYSMGFACDTEINASEGAGHILQLLGRVGGGSGSLVGLGMSASTMG